MSAYVTLAPRSVRGARERAPGGKNNPLRVLNLHCKTDTAMDIFLL